MKKTLAVVLTMGLAISFAGCGSNASTENAETAVEETVSEAAETVAETVQAVEEAVSDDDAKSEGVMTYAEYTAAAVDSEVTIETYVQAKQGWWENEGVGNATFYTQDKDGGYFLYNMPCTEDEYAQLTEGTKIKVTGYKSEWAGEVEITDATFEIEDGSYVASAEDITSVLGSDSLSDYMNRRISAKGLTVADKGDGAAFYYNWDNSGSVGDDLYFDVELDGNVYTFTVESYLCGSDSDVYKAVEALQVGDTIDVEGFLYWYEGANPHITKVTVK